MDLDNINDKTIDLITDAVIRKMIWKFKQEVLWRVTVDVNGKQEYVFNTTDYDHLCDKLTDVMIKETL